MLCFEAGWYRGEPPVLLELHLLEYSKGYGVYLLYAGIAKFRIGILLSGKKAL